MLEFTVVKVLAAIFTPDFNITNSLKIANVAFNLLEGRLDGEPTILPIPQDAPADIPRITLQSSDKLLSLSVAPSRTNLEFSVPIDLVVDVIDYSSYYSDLPKFLVEFSSELGLMVQRIGYVTERLIIRDDVLSLIMDKFCNKAQTSKGRPFHNPKRFEIHSLKKYNWEDFQLNSWVRLRYLPITIKDEENKPALLVQNDLNTLSYKDDPGSEFNTKVIEKFFDNIPSHLEQIWNLYFE
ncbi:MAG: hypothetical protein V3S16_01710 [Candidatus Desulfatibia sp.]|uniref:hypothetical protein n=1 Tax=Candidatus Desulfatibia sp. TaxID=3101189 RepID=UPI002F2CD78C